jgi:hypothetical protein
MNKNRDFGFSKIFKPKKRIPVDELELTQCQNCGYEFKGHYCPDCGQEVAEFNRPLGFIMYDFMGNFFAFDTRFFKTFKYLLFYPGFLTIEFFKGRRKTYSPPFRIFVFLSFILFLILSFLSEKSLESQFNAISDNNPETIQNNIETFNNEILKETGMDSTLSRLYKNNKDTADLNINLEQLFIGKGSLRERLNQVALILEKEQNETSDPAVRQKLEEYIIMCRAPEIAISQLLKYLSWASFILLPLFAFILKLFYLRRKQLYIKHLLFSIHIHSFTFVVLILLTLPWLIFGSLPGIVNTVLIFSIPVYIIIAMHHFYRQRWLKTLGKFVLIGITYNFILSTVVLLAFLKSLHVF